MRHHEVGTRQSGTENYHTKMVLQACPQTPLHMSVLTHVSSHSATISTSTLSTSLQELNCMKDLMITVPLTP